MKTVRFTLALCAAVMLAASAMALEVEVSGHYFIEHFNNSNYTLNKNDATDDYSSMELMVKPVFKITDNITLTTQFTALQDHVWGTDANPRFGTSPLPPISGGEPFVDSSNNIDWKAAYLTIKTPIGGFIAGRYIDTPWGTTFGDTTASHGSNDFHKDRIMWVAPVKDFIVGAVHQVNQEGDKGNVVSDQDFTKSYVFGAYRQPNWSAGLLVANYTHKDYLSSKNLNRTINQAAQAQVYGGLAQQAAAAGNAAAAAQFAALAGAAAANSEAAWNTRGDMTLWVLDPYVMGTFGKFGVKGEMLFGWGDIDQNGLGTDNLDAEGLGYVLDLSYDFGPVTLMAGTTYIQGDWNLDDTKTGPIGYFERSNDHERGFLLTSDVSNLQTSLGGRVDTAVNLNGTLGMPMGNLAGGPGTVTGQAGAQMFYFDIGWQALENLKLGFLFVTSKADDVPRGNNPLTGAVAKWDDDHGKEYDFTVEWNIMDNLTFKGVVAHLDAGDYWKQGDPNKEITDNTTFYGQLIVKF